MGYMATEKNQIQFRTDLDVKKAFHALAGRLPCDAGCTDRRQGGGRNRASTGAAAGPAER